MIVGAFNIFEVKAEDIKIPTQWKIVLRNQTKPYRIPEPGEEFTFPELGKWFTFETEKVIVQIDREKIETKPLDGKAITVPIIIECATNEGKALGGVTVRVKAYDFNNLYVDDYAASLLDQKFTIDKEVDEKETRRTVFVVIPENKKIKYRISCEHMGMIKQYVYDGETLIKNQKKPISFKTTEIIARIDPESAAEYNAWLAEYASGKMVEYNPGKKRQAIDDLVKMNRILCWLACIVGFIGLVAILLYIKARYKTANK